MLIYTSKRPGWGKQKPAQWGPISAVQSAVRHNADALSLPDLLVVFPLWEQAGELPINYGSLPLQPFRAAADAFTVPWVSQGLDCTNNYRKFALQTNKGTVRFPYSGHVHIRLKEDESFSGYNYLFYMRDNTTNSRVGLNLAYGDRLYYAHGYVFLSSSLGSIGDGPTFDISTNFSPSGLGISVNGRSFAKVSESWADSGSGGLNRYGFLDMDGGTNYGYSNGDVYIYQHFAAEISADQIAQLHDTPYALLQPVPQTYVFDMGASLVPSLIAPAKGLTGVNQPISFEWGAVDGASAYQLQIDEAAGDFSAPVVDDATLTGTTKEVSGLTDGTEYKWRVRADV